VPPWLDAHNDIEANVSGDNVSGPGTGLNGFPGTYAGVYGTRIWGTAQ
jgi:hypothetical protein